MSSSSSNNIVYSFATDRKTYETLRIVETTTPTTTTSNNIKSITFDILYTGMSANNKFYLDFGDKIPFHFHKCYPIDTTKSKFVGDNDNDEDLSDKYVHPVVWGICRVKESYVKDVKVGSYYIGQLPMAESVVFVNGGTVATDGTNALTIHRPAVHAAYNVFQLLTDDSPYLSKEYGPFGCVCFPGIITGFGLYFDLKHRKFFDKKENKKNHVVITAASSKVALSLALFLKKDKEGALDGGRKLIGYTSDKNKEFVKKTGLYDIILGYDEKLEDSSSLSQPTKEEEEDAASSTINAIMIDISGNGSIYSNNIKSKNINIVKLLVIGNAAAVPDKDSTFSTFGKIATIKMIMTMMGTPSWITYWLPDVTQELWLIMDIMSILRSELGNDGFTKTMIEYATMFCKEAIENWNMTIRECTTEETIIQAFRDIVNGTVPPTEAISFDIGKAVAHRHVSK